jgi:4-amino-4-deoxy-L-arabinose transferase-like glycosyltransferase
VRPASFLSTLAAPRIALALILALTIARVGLIMATPLELHGDEAQYWNWSRTLDWGYFSKPPLIAWAIRATTDLFGNDEWAVRLAAPLAQGAAAALVYLLGRRLYGDGAGAWAALGWALMPGVQLSSVIISTDALLLPLWALALLALWRLSETGRTRWAIVLGAALGFGVLAKYAMFYFPLGAGLACLLSPRARGALLSPRGALAVGLAVLIAAPNMIWNVTHHFATIAHTADNAAIGRTPFQPQNLLTFLAEQFGVIGPLQCAALFYLLFDAARRPGRLDERDRFLISFVIPALAIISVEALISRANANWAAAAYPAAIVWIAGRFAGGRGPVLLASSAGLHAVIAALAFAAILSPPFADAIGLGNSLKRSRGWEASAAAISAEARAQGKLSAVMVDNRLLYYDLAYYWRGGRAPAPLRMWQLEESPGNSAEMSAPMTPAYGARTLIVMASPSYRDFIFEDFETAHGAGELSIPLGGKKIRKLDLAVGSGFAPAPRDGAFKARLDARRRGDED